jgi:heme o synthase
VVPGDRERGGNPIESVSLAQGPEERAESDTPDGLVVAASLVAKPGIVAGVVLSGFAGMALAARGLPPLRTALAGLSAILLAAAGSAILNGLLDASFDERMPRVAGRVRALSRLGKRGALALAAGFIIAGLSIAVRSLNAVAALLILAAVLGYTVLYTVLLKRRSPYGTIPGGIPGALPVLIGYAAVTPRIGIDGGILFLLMLLWQPPHFWTLALKHREEYAAAGIPVLPVVFGESYTRIFMFLYGMALLPLSLSLWVLGFLSPAFALLASGLWICFLWSCYANAVRARRFGRAFGASILYILGLLLALIADVGIRAIL